MAADYRRFRPQYPSALFAYLAEHAPGREHAVDVATGNGQAAVGLSAYFARVSAFDASAAQIAQAVPAPRVCYGVAPAEAIALGDAEADVITVAQSLHWLDLDRVYAEARRVLRHHGLFAATAYNRLTTLDPAVDRVVERLYSDIVGDCWPAERVHIEQGYADLPFPFPRLDTPEFAMTAQWNVDALLGYLGTWSAVKRYRQTRGGDPLALIEDDLRAGFGPGERMLRWPLVVLVGRVAAR